MAEFAALPLFTDAWIADTAHLSRVERGLYMDLLILMWRSPQCRIPADLSWISRKLNCRADEADMLAAIVDEFCRRDRKFLYQKRLIKEWDYTAEKRGKQVRAAKLRWQKQKEPCERIYQDDAGQERPQSERNAPSPSPSPSPSSSAAKAAQKRATRCPANWMPAPLPRDLATEIAQMPAGWIERELAAMRDWSASSPKGAKLDWDAAWRQWLRRRITEGQTHDTAQQHRGGAHRNGSISPRQAAHGELLAEFAGPADDADRYGAPTEDPGQAFGDVSRMAWE